FLVGDDYGVPTDLPWGVAFPVGLPGPTTAGYLASEYGIAPPPGTAPSELLRVHPTQLYETAAGLLVWWVGVRMIRRGAASGRTAVLSFGLLAAARFAVEFVRAKDDRFFGPLTLAQVLSLGVVAAMAGLALWAASRRRRAGDAAEEP
ncbi:MAG: prolipoprotein diacylglyceryl transferase, partial [Thermoanaerobaculia bacterium]|nr:prolipoprotein diacylglyceryl transferase [Thermoanaerobaculia bacterium]